MAGAATFIIFFATNTCLSGQNTSLKLLSRQTYLSFVATSLLLSRQNTCLLRQIFVATKIFCCDKNNFVATRDGFCRDKHVFVTTKRILVAAPAYDMLVRWLAFARLTFHNFPAPSSKLCQTWLRH